MSEWKVPGYTELRTLGSGTFGQVVLARHDASGVMVAIKYLRTEMLADADFVEMFRAEAETLASLDDQNVVRLYEYVESATGAAIVMELIDGVSLREILDHQGSTTAEAALVVLRGSLLGLAAAHQRGVVHRDYKPENVLVDGEGLSKLTDFGIAARTGDRPVLLGTLLYAPPEQVAGGTTSPASDVYAATATFYECLTGRPPFSGKTSGELIRQHRYAPVALDPVPEPLRPLVAAGMAKEPGNRPADASVFVTELNKAASGSYGPQWDERGRSHLGETALALAALWPSGQAPAVHGSAVHRIDLSEDTAESREARHAWHIRHVKHLRHLKHLRALLAAAAVAVVAGTAVAAAGLSHPKLTADVHPAPAQTLSLQPSPSPVGSSPSVSGAFKSPPPKKAFKSPPSSPSGRKSPPSPSSSPAVITISPSSGSTRGGAAVAITGTGLADAAEVSFGGVAGKITADSGTQITVTSPAGQGTVDITVTTPAGTSAITAADRFTYSVPGI
jgi:eukaryotic-like serine/threonine-protein kinase